MVTSKGHVGLAASSFSVLKETPMTSTLAIPFQKAKMLRKMKTSPLLVYCAGG